MIFSIYVPLAVGLLLGFVAPVVARRAHAGTGMLALSVAIAGAGLGSVWALVLIIATLWDDLPGVDRGVTSSVPDVLAVAAAAWLLVAGLRALGVVLARRRMHRGLHAAVAGIDCTSDGVTVIADPRPEAFAVPACRPAPARIVVTEGMLRALGPRQRLAMYAHERAHLDGRHHRLRAVAEVAAAVNPALGPASRAMAHLCERSADERAAAHVGDRGLVAEAVAMAALASRATGSPAYHRTLGFGHLGVVQRVAALHRPARTHRRVVALVAGAAVLVVLLAAGDATLDFIHFARALTGP